MTFFDVQSYPYSSRRNAVFASGPAPRAASIDAYRKLGGDAIPLYGPL